MAPSQQTTHLTVGLSGVLDQLNTDHGDCNNSRMHVALTLQCRRRPGVIAIAEAALASGRITLPHRNSISCEDL